MPASKEFLNRLEAITPELVAKFGTPFHIYDEKGIIANGERLKKAFANVPGFREYFAVKALPNPHILGIMKDLGFGFDCSSIPELVLSRAIGATGEDIMFTSNNTSSEEFAKALSGGGCILNIDDISMIDDVVDFPKLICFRYNPGEGWQKGDMIFPNPVKAKYGVRDDQIIDAYRQAILRGAERFGLHMMICSNQLDSAYILENVMMLLKVIERISGELGIQFEFINIGGGIGTPYEPGQRDFDIETLGAATTGLFNVFKKKNGYAPKLFIESGRYMTGPYGVLVTKVINRMHKYCECVGVDACMSSLMRPAIYGAYHHISVFQSKGWKTEKVDVVGSLCENNDKFAIDRQLPVTKRRDILYIHNTGAHAIAMCFQYNGRLRPKELLLKTDGSVRLIRREETLSDYFATLSGL